MKIAIIGYSGSGKSTLARILGEKYGIEVLHLDKVQFLPNWELRGKEEKMRMTEEFLNTHSSWVIDGNYSLLSFDRRMREADRIVVLLFSRLTCLCRVVRRNIQHKNKVRPDMADGCIEKLDREFILWILRDGRSREKNERYRRVIDTYPEKVHVLKNPRQTEKFLKELGVRGEE